MTEKARVYLDACCFIDMAKQKIGVPLTSTRASDVWFLWKVLEAHKAGDVAAYTSTLSIADCTHADGNMEKPTRDLFMRLLTSGQFVLLVQPTPIIAADG